MIFLNFQKNGHRACPMKEQLQASDLCTQIHLLGALPLKPYDQLYYEKED